jgi:RHS repeat-associated protein
MTKMTTTNDIKNKIFYIHPFGMPLPGRSKSDYRYGFTGHEKEDEITGSSGTVYSTEYRLLDTRLAIWRTPDPLAAKFPNISSYHYCSNNPILKFDPDGRVEAIRVSDGKGGVKLQVAFTPNTNGQTRNGVLLINPNENSFVTFTLQRGTVTANDGTAIEAWRLVGATLFEDYNRATGIHGTQTDILAAKANNPKSYPARYDGYIDAAKSNCHGTVYANGDVWIMDDAVANLISSDGYTPSSPYTGNAPATFYDLNQDRSVNFNMGIHSVKATGGKGSTPGDFTYDSKTRERAVQTGQSFSETSDNIYQENPSNLQFYTPPSEGSLKVVNR